VQVAGGGIGGLFSWLFGPRGGGADDAEEVGGQEATTALATTSTGRGGRNGGSQPQVEVAEVGPEAVARAKSNLPTGPAYAGPAAPAPAAKPQVQVADAGPEAVAKAKRNLPTGPAYASAAEPAPPVKPQTVAALQQTDIASDASTDEPRSAAGAKLFAPLPPRRPADLDAAVALADAPMPPVRPADLILASATQQGGGAFAPPSNKGAAVAPGGSLPRVITAGVDRAPTGALALAEGLSLPKHDDGELLARAAGLTAPLPPMPVPSAVAAPAPEKAAATLDKIGAADQTAAAPQAHGWVVRTAAAAAEDLAQWFGVSKAAPPAPGSGELRGGAQP